MSRGRHCLWRALYSRCFPPAIKLTGCDIPELRLCDQFVRPLKSRTRGRAIAHGTPLPSTPRPSTSPTWPCWSNRFFLSGGCYANRPSSCIAACWLSSETRKCVAA